MKFKLLSIAVITVLFYSCTNDAVEELKTDSFYLPDVNLSAEEVRNGVLTHEMLWKFGRVGSYDVCPNNERMTYNITYYCVEENRGYTHIFLVPIEGGEPTQLTGGEISCINPRWTPDGERIAYLSAKSGSNQIWTMNPDGSNKKQISDFENSINHFEFSPAGDRLYFTSRVKLDKSPQDIYPDLPKANVHIADELMYRHWNRWHDYKYSHIFIADFDGNSVNNYTDIMKGEPYDAPLSPYFNNAEITWSPCGEIIAYSCKKMPKNEYAVSTNADLYLYNLNTGITKNITPHNFGYDKFPAFSNDGEYIAWMSMETPGYESDKKRLFVMNLETKEFEDISVDFDHEVIDINWKNDDIYFISGINATYQIFKIDTNTREITQLTDGVHNYTSIEVIDDFILANKMSMSMANEFFVLDLDGAERQLTFTNQHIYDNIEMGKVEERWVRTTDNKKMLVWLIYPPKFDENKEYPAILYCQGGPQSAVSQFFSYRWNFQIMASNGYVVIAPNRRGLPSFGTEWNAQISGDYGGQNMRDYVSAVKAMKKKDFIDEDRIGAVGASYGGFSVFWLAGNKPDLFKAFISHCGIFNFESMYASTEELFFLNHDYGGAFWEKDNPIAQRSYANSPHKFVQNWNTPILIIAGQNDFRIPYTESLQAFNSAQMHGVPSRLLVFPEETHFVLKPQNSILWQREFKGWLDKWLK